MSEENKQEAQPTDKEQQLNTPSTDETVVPSAETSTETENPSTSNPQPLNHDMEVHHHAHDPVASHHKKNWKAYFWEFLMLFFAVFCGFLAEYQLEHIIEKEREKKFLKNLVEDLKQDTLAFTKSMSDFKLVLENDDSLIQLLNSSDIKEHGAELYYMGRLSSRTYPVIVNDATIQQLKNSGGFRLIGNDKVVKKIMEYYNQLVFINHLQDIELLQSQDYRKLAIDVFHPLIFNSIISPDDNSIVRPLGNPSLLTYDVPALRRLSGMVSYHRSAKLGLLISQRNMKKAAIALMMFIQKKYYFE